MATDKQLALIDNLLNERDIFNGENSKFDGRTQGEYEYREELRGRARVLTKFQASAWITRLMELPR